MLSRSIPALLCAVSLVAGAQQAATGADSSDITRFGATTTNMEPDGLALRFDVLAWSDEAARSAAIAALEAEDAQDALDELPTVGYVWPDGSPVGYAIKYAHTTATDSGERLTFVTSRPLGSYDFGGWTIAGNAPGQDLAYSVIELELDGSGAATGTASLAAPVSMDAAAGMIALERSGETVALFSDVQRLEVGY